MSKIDYSPNSAELSGISKPTLDQIAAIVERIPAQSWSPSRPDASATNKVVPKFYFIPLGALALIFCGLSNHLSIGEPQLSLVGAQTIYVVAKKPSSSLTAVLREAHHNRAAVRLITSATPVGVEFQCITVAPEKIVTEGILIDGTKWVPMN